MSTFEPMVEFSIYVPVQRATPGPDVHPFLTAQGLLEHFAARYGGATFTAAQGSYKDSAGSVIVGGMSVISVMVEQARSDCVREDFKRFALAVAEEYDQECVLITERTANTTFIARTPK